MTTRTASFVGPGHPTEHPADVPAAPAGRLGLRSRGASAHHRAYSWPVTATSDAALFAELSDAIGTLPAAQQPAWPDAVAMGAAVDQLCAMPPLVFAGECDLLRQRLAAVSRGEAFLLQGGDCAETFDGVTAGNVRNKLKTLLQMAVVLTYAASVPVVKVGRIAGQYAKPRSRSTETRGDVTLPAYRGDIVDLLEYCTMKGATEPAAITLGQLRGWLALQDGRSMYQ